MRAAPQRGGRRLERGQGGRDERVPAARRQQHVHVAGRAAAGNGAERQVAERLGEQLGHERDREPTADEAANRELVAGEGDDVRLEPGGATGAHDEAVGDRGGPVLVAQVAERDLGTAGEWVVRREGDLELLPKKVAALHARRLVARLGRVLEGDRQVELTGPDPRGEVAGALVDGHAAVRVRGPQVVDGGGDEGGQGGRECADAQPRAPALRGGRELLAREPEPVRDRVRVPEQDLALGGEPEAAGLAIEQAHADLALERGDLVGDRRLRERERAGGAREGPLVSDRAKREDASRIHSQTLSVRPNDQRRLWPRVGRPKANDPRSRTSTPVAAPELPPCRRGARGGDYPAARSCQSAFCSGSVRSRHGAVSSRRTETFTSTTLRTPRRTSTVARASASSASTSPVTTSTTLNRRGRFRSGAFAGFGARFGGTNGRAALPPGSDGGLSSGTMLAPVPFVPVSRTQTLAIFVVASATPAGGRSGTPRRSGANDERGRRCSRYGHRRRSGARARPARGSARGACRPGWRAASATPRSARPGP